VLVSFGYFKKASAKLQVNYSERRPFLKTPGEFFSEVGGKRGGVCINY
jgi:hypothetical protein